MNRTFSFLFFFLSFTLFSQEVILYGEVTDTLKQPLNGANIIIKQKQKIIAYTTSDDKGRFEKRIPMGINYNVKVTYLGYITIEKPLVNLTKRTRLNFILKESETSLEDVIITTKIPEIIQKKDTTIYNLSALTDGTESTLKDIIEKLPGLSIDNNGKVAVNGKKIDKILINGKDFFNKQHQFATDNIASEMIQGIEFYTRFKTDFDSRSDSPVRALNVKLKEKYLNKFTGNIILMGAYKNRYKIHPNIFNFRKKMNLAFIGDLNNMGQPALSLNDYMELRGGVNNFIKGELTAGIHELEEDEIPSFLLKNTKVKDKNTYFGGVNIVYVKPKKVSFNGLYLYNLMDATEKILSRKQYWNGPITDHYEKLKGKYIILNTASEIKYRFSPKTTMSFLVTSDWQKNTERGNNKNDIDTLNFNKNYNGVVFGSKINFVHNYNENDIWDTHVLCSYNNTNRNLNLRANYFIFDGIFPFDSEKILNTTLKTNVEISWLTKYTKFYKKSQYAFRLGSAFRNTDYQVNNDFEQLSNYLKLNKKDYFLGLGYKYDALALHIKTKVDLHHVNLHLKSFNTTTNYLYIAPFVNITYLFNLSHSLSFGYFLSHNFITDTKLLPNDNIIDINVVYQGDNSNRYFYPKHQFFLSYTNYLKEIKWYYDFTVNYSWEDNVISRKLLQVTPKISYYKNTTIPYSNNWNLIFTTNKLLHKHFYINYKVDLSFNNKRFDSQSLFKYLRFYNILKIYSKYKKVPFNFSFGINHAIYQSVYEKASKSIFKIYQPFLTLRGNLKEHFFWKVKTTYENYEFNNNAYFFNVNPSIEYRFKKYYYISIIGNNILRLNKSKQIQWQTNTNFVEQKTLFDMPGYISLQLKYNY